jgi:hypothetical protein
LETSKQGFGRKKIQQLPGPGLLEKASVNAGRPARQFVADNADGSLRRPFPKLTSHSPARNLRNVAGPDMVARSSKNCENAQLRLTTMTPQNGPEKMRPSDVFGPQVTALLLHRLVRY